MRRLVADGYRVTAADLLFDELRSNTEEFGDGVLAVELDVTSAEQWRAALDYARRLLAAGVPMEIEVFRGTCHGFDSLLPNWEMSRQLHAMQGAALTRGLS